MNKQEYLAELEKLKLPKTDYIILSGGSLLLRGLRDTTADLDLCVTETLAHNISLYDKPKDNHGFYALSDNCQMIIAFNQIEFDTVDGYRCESLKSILAFKKKNLRPKDIKDVENIEKYLKNNQNLDKK